LEATFCLRSVVGSAAVDVLAAAEERMDGDGTG
jgi:hypothetical protein